MAMYKIIAAINSMISNQQLITHATKNGNEIFFIYDGKFKWSIIKGEDGDYFLHYYPNKESFEELVAKETWQESDSISYSTVELKAREALESFSELFQVVKNKLYNIDEVLDSIINTTA